MDKRAFYQLFAFAVTCVLLFSFALPTTQGLPVTPQQLTESMVITPDTDGRGYGVVEPGYGPGSVEVLDYDTPYITYNVNYNHGYTTELRQYLAPETNLIWDPSGTHQYDPNTFDKGPFVSPSKLPKYLLTKNSTPTSTEARYTLTVYGNITLGWNVESSFTMNGGAVYQALVNVTSNTELFAFTGEVTLTTSYIVVDPNLTVVRYGSLYGYFAIPIMRCTPGGYSIYLYSSYDVAISLTPTPIVPTMVGLGDRDSGEINLAALHVGPTGDLYVQEVPPQIVAIATEVQLNDEISFFKSVHDIAGGGYQVLAYSSGQDGYGLPYGYDITWLSTSYQQKILRNGTAYIVLVAYTGAHFKYTIGFDDTTFSSVQIGTPFRVNTILPTTEYKYFTFEVLTESVGRFNYTILDSGGQSFTLFRLDSVNSIIYRETGLFREGWAQDNYQYTYHLFPGSYVLQLSTSSPSATLLQINTYSLESVPASFTSTPGEVHAFAMDTPRFSWETFNLSLTSQANVSVFLRFTFFNAFNEYLKQYTLHLGNRQENGVWQETYGSYWCEDGSHFFEGNESLQKYFTSYLQTTEEPSWITFEVLHAYNTTPAGTPGDRWTFMPAATPSFDLVPTNYIYVVEITETTLDSSSGTGSISVPITNFGFQLFWLELTPQPSTWTQMQLTMLNGTISDIDIVDAYRYLINSFDSGHSLGLLPPDEISTNIYGFTNMTTYVEFGVIDTAMLFLIFLNCESPDGGEFRITVTHQPTTTLQGISPPPPIETPGPFPVIPIELVVGVLIVIVIVIIIAVVILWRRRKY